MYHEVNDMNDMNRNVYTFSKISKHEIFTASRFYIINVIEILNISSKVVPRKLINVSV